MTDFKPGDVVCLTSGGPLMTVEQVQPASEDGSTVLLNVCWFSGKESDKLERATFNSTVLESVSRELTVAPVVSGNNYTRAAAIADKTSDVAF